MGKLFMILKNPSNKIFYGNIGDRIVQLTIEKYGSNISITEVKDFTNKTVRENGF